MANIFGSIGLADNDRVFNGVVGQQTIFEIAKTYVAERNAELDLLTSVFIERTTEDFKWRYKLPGGGFLGTIDGQGRYGNSKASGKWDVAFPLHDYGREIAGNRVALAYMTAEEFSLHVDNVVMQNVNTMRFRILKALFNENQDTFTDPIQGSLSIEPLANGDSVVYPPVVGSTTEATEDHYLESGYAATAISDTNNPYKVLVAELDHHTGEVTGGDAICTFIHRDEVPETEDLSDFVQVEDRFIRQGNDADVPFGLPNVPGKIIGRTNGSWVVQWSHIPTGYALSVNLDETPPLIKRTDPSDTGLPVGLTLVEPEEGIQPYTSSTWVHRFGLGAGNRLNGVAMEFGSGGTYTTPTAYA